MSTFIGRMREYTDISLDRFDGINLESNAYFLSHNHADHTVGLASVTLRYRLQSERRIKLYCSEVTRHLLLCFDKYKHLEESIVTLPLNETCIVSVPDLSTEKEKYKLNVTLLPAGHCPGSVMCLFEGHEETVLYTGDIRLDHGDISRIEALKSGSGPKELKSLYIDTTFCVPAALFIPSRDESSNAVIAIAEEWISQSRNHMVVIKYKALLGYEDLFRRLAEHFSTKKLGLYCRLLYLSSEAVHVTNEKYEQYLGLADMSKFTTPHPEDTQIHACKYQSDWSGESALPCGYKPTTDDNQPLVRTIYISTMAFVQQVAPESYARRRNERWFHVCYSFHSSYGELREVIFFLRPHHAYPNVIPMGDTMPQIEERLNGMVNLARRSLQPRSPGQPRELGKLKRKRKWKRASTQQFQHSENLDFGDAESSPEKRRCTNTRQPMRTSFPLLLGDGDGDDVVDGMSNEHKGASQDKEQSSGQDSSYEPSDTERLNASFELFDDNVKLEEEKNVMTSFAPTKDGSYGEYAFYVSDEDEEGTSASQPVDIWSQIDSVDILKAERQCPVKSLMSENGFIVSKFTPGEEMRGLNGPVDETNAQEEMGDGTKAVISELSVADDTCVESERERVTATESGEQPGNGKDVKTFENASDVTNTENTRREVTDMDADDSMAVETNTSTANTHGKMTDTNTDDLTTGEVNTHEKTADAIAVDSTTDDAITTAANACVEVTDAIVVDSSNSTRECRTPEIYGDKLKTATTMTDPMLSSTGESKTNATPAQEETVVSGEARYSVIPNIQGNENIVAVAGMENVSKVDELDWQHVSRNKKTDKYIRSERKEGLSDKTGECDNGGTVEESKTSDDAKSLKNGAAPRKASGSETDDDILNEPDQKQGNPTTETADMSETEDDILNVLASPQKQVKTPKETVMSETEADILNVSASSPSQKYVDPVTKRADMSETEDDVLLASPPSKKQVNTITKEADMSETEDVSDILNASASTSPQTQVNRATKADTSKIEDVADVLNVSASPPSKKQVNPTTKKADRSETEDDILNVSASSPSQKYVDPATKKAAMSETENMADVLNVSASPPSRRQVNPAKKTEMSEVKDMADVASAPSQKRAKRTTRNEDTSKTEDVADVLNVSASPPQKRAKPTSTKADMSETEDDVLLASPPSQKRVKPTTKTTDMSKVKDVADVLNVSAYPPSQKQVNPTKSKREDSSALRDENGEWTNRCGNKATSRVEGGSRVEATSRVGGGSRVEATSRVGGGSRVEATSRVEGGEDVASSTDVIVIDDDETAVATSNRESTTWPPHDTVDITCETTDTDATVDPTVFPTACCSGVGPKRTGPVLAVSGLMMDDTTTSTSDSYSSHGGGKRRRRRRWRKDRRSNTHDMSQFHRHSGGGDDNPGPSCSRQSGGTIDLTSDDDAMAAGDTGRVHTAGVTAFDGYCADNESGSSDSDASTVGEWDDRDSPLFTTKRDRRASSDMDVIVVDDDTTDDCASENGGVASEGNVASEHDTRTVPDNDKPSAAPTAIVEK